MVSVEGNIALVRRFFETRGKGDLNAIEELLTPDFVVHTKLFPDQQSDQSDRDGYLRATAEYSAAFSNVRILVEDQVAGGDKAVTRFIVRATHDREEISGVATYWEGDSPHDDSHPPYIRRKNRRGVGRGNEHL